MSQPRYSGESQRLNLLARREHARQQLQKVSAPDYVKSLVGTIGAQPLPALLGQTPLKHVELTTV
jgi:hypothetical protein